jgi:hypothetical protein
MSKLRAEFQVAGTAPDTISACRTVAANEGWTIRSEEPDRLLLRQGYKLTAWPLTMDVHVTSTADSGTLVGVDGSIWGLGPIQKSHLRKAMAKLQNQVAQPPAP